MLSLYRGSFRGRLNSNLVIMSLTLFQNIKDDRSDLTSVFDTFLLLLVFSLTLLRQLRQLQLKPLQHIIRRDSGKDNIELKRIIWQP